MRRRRVSNHSDDRDRSRNGPERSRNDSRGSGSGYGHGGASGGRDDGHRGGRGYGSRGGGGDDDSPINFSVNNGGNVRGRGGGSRNVGKDRSDRNESWNGGSRGQSSPLQEEMREHQQSPMESPVKRKQQLITGTHNRRSPRNHRSSPVTSPALTLSRKKLIPSSELSPSELLPANEPPTLIRQLSTNQPAAAHARQMPNIGQVPAEFMNMEQRGKCPFSVQIINTTF